MSGYLIPIIIICACLGALLFFVIRHWKDICVLNVNRLPKVRFAQTKHRILEERVRRKTMNWFSKVIHYVLHPLKMFFAIFHVAYEGVKKLERHYRVKKQMKLKPEKANERIRLLLAQADNLVRKEEYADAEKKYLDALSIDPKQIKAYKGLGNLYEQKKDEKAAIEVYKHVARLDAKDDEVRCKLTELYKYIGDDKNAMFWIQDALALEPNHPKYLHLFIELSILRKDVKHAHEALKLLKSVNPQNQKLKEWAKQIKELSSSVQ